MALAQLFEIGDIQIGNQGANTDTILAQLKAEKEAEELRKKEARAKLYQQLAIVGGAVVLLILIVVIYKILTKPQPNGSRSKRKKSTTS